MGLCGLEGALRTITGDAMAMGEGDSTLCCSAMAGEPQGPLEPLQPRFCPAMLLSAPHKEAVKRPRAGYETFPGEIKPNHLSLSSVSPVASEPRD